MPSTSKPPTEYYVDIMTQVLESTNLVPSLPPLLPCGTSAVSSQSRPQTGKKNTSQSTMQHQGALHLLTLPPELLDAIWLTIQEADDRERKPDWFSRPKDKLANVRLVCREIYHNVRACQPNHITPYSKFSQLMEGHIADTMLNYEIAIKRYRSVSIELDLQSSCASFAQLAAFLREAKYLEELKLYFFGRDAYDTRVFVHGCGKGPLSGRERRLPLDGQRSPKQTLPILKAIRSLHRLRILVINNMNCQLFQAVFKDKPWLQYVHVTSDPRSALHTQYDLNDLGPLAPPLKEYFPPVQAAHMSANSTLGGVAFLSNCAPTLKHLTWTVPASSLASGLANANFFRNTEQLLENLRLKGCQLETLRVCIADAGMYESQSVSVGSLQLGLTHVLHHFTKLRHYELHADVNQGHFGLTLLRWIPSTLSRLYANEKLIALCDLNELISEKYLYAELSVARKKARRFQDRWNNFDQDRRDESIACLDVVYKDFPALSDNVHFWINPLSYNPRTFNDSLEHLGESITRKSDKRNGRALYLDGIVGETLHDRDDYIPLNSGDLGFVAYEFDKTNATRRTLKTGETPTQMVLRLNGRLLDRERNFHLRAYREGHNTNPRKKNNSSAADLETGRNSSTMGIQLLLHALYEVEATAPRDTKALSTELADSQFSKSMHWYFGNENEAVEVFEAEAVASPRCLPPYRYPIVVDDEGSADGHCYWLCPEADVIPIGTWDDMRAEYRALKQKEQQSAEGVGSPV